MKHYEYFAGVDISKATLDLSVTKKGKQVLYQRIENNPKAISKFIKAFQKQLDCDLNNGCFLHGAYRSLWQSFISRTATFYR